MDLREYLQTLDSQQLLTSISRPCSTELEIADICRREFRTADGGKALLFNKPDNGNFQLAANLFGSEQRLLTMLGLESLHQLEQSLMQQLAAVTGSSRERLLEICNESAPTQEGLSQLKSDKNFDLRKLPALRTWKQEGGRYLTLALTVTGSMDKRNVNLGLYRAQILNENHLALNFSPLSDAGKQLAEATIRNVALPVALVLGGDPALIWAASAPLPAGCSELGFCSSFLGRKSFLQDCLTVPLMIPTEVEMVIEGYIVPGETCVEGPFGNHTGCYVERTDCPVMQVKAVSYRDQPVLPMTVVGPPPSENIYLGIASQVLIKAMLKIDFPEILDLHMPLETIFHQAVLLSIHSNGRDCAEQLIKQLWQHSPLQRSRLMILLDEDINLRQQDRCWWRAVNMLDAGRIYQDRGRTAIDATGVDPAQLIDDNLTDH